MREDYPQWLIEQGYKENTQNAQIYRVQRVEEFHGNLDEHFTNGTYQKLITALNYSADDQRQNRPNPSNIPIEGNIRNSLQSYKNAVVRYKKFLTDPDFRASPRPHNLTGTEQVDTSVDEDSIKQKFALERDMQEAIRCNIASLESTLKIIDDGAERAVDSGFIDITCEDDTSIVVIELKAGKADGKAIAQILGYMGDIQEEEEKEVRGILIAHDFDKRAKAAARIVPSLKLKTYAIEFKFNDPE